MSQDTHNMTEEAQDVPLYRIQPEPQGITSPQAMSASKTLAQTFGLDVRAAMLVTLVDLMIFSVDILSAGAFVVMGIVVAALLGFIVYKIQRRWYGDDHDSSLIKSLIVGLLTAIPIPLTPLVAVPCGILGLVQMCRRK